MNYTGEGIKATHQEMVDWLQWRAQQMLRAGAAPEAVRTWGSLTSSWLSTGSQYIMQTTARPEDVCDTCGGSGRSKLVVALGSTAQCSACEGTGIKPKAVSGFKVVEGGNG